MVNSYVSVVRYGRVAAMCLKGSLEVADSLAEKGCRVVHEFEARTPIQPAEKELELRR
jgi:hypothetical protein